MVTATRDAPYVVPGPGPDGTDPDLLAGLPAYAVPGSMETARDPRYGWNGDGYATPLDEGTISTPDANRLRHEPLHSTTPIEGPPVRWWSRYVADFLGRHRVEYQDADGFEVAAKDKPSYYERPRPSDTGEPRPTNRMSPNTYVFTRPFPGLGTTGRFTGVHFSMADFRRDYPIGGMDPARKVRRNTYRLEPEPWDTDLVDMPGTVDVSPDVQVVAQPVGVVGGSRSWRL